MSHSIWAGTIVFDLETQRLFENVGGRFPERLGLAVAVTWDEENGFREWWEAEVHRLLAELSRFRLVIGFNLLRFDYAVLSAYKPEVFSLLSGKTVDIMNDVYRQLNFRVSLGDLANATLGHDKTANGIEAVRLWREGKHEEVIEYCRRDVALTRDLYAYGLTHGVIYYPSYGLKRPIPMHWS